MFAYIYVHMSCMKLKQLFACSTLVPHSDTEIVNAQRLRELFTTKITGKKPVSLDGLIVLTKTAIANSCFYFGLSCLLSKTV